MERTTPKDYVAITALDRGSKTAIKATLTDDLPEKCALRTVGTLVYNELTSGVVEDDIRFDAGIDGCAMLVFECDRGATSESLDMQFTMNPHVSVHSGELSGAQALVLSALRRAEARLRLSDVHLDLTNVVADERDD